MLAAVNVADACYLLYHINPVDKDEPQDLYKLIGIDTPTGEQAEIVIYGEANAYLHLSVLISSEEMYESGWDFDDEDPDDKIVAAYKALQASPMKRFMP